MRCKISPRVVENVMWGVMPGSVWWAVLGAVLGDEWWSASRVTLEAGVRAGSEAVLWAVHVGPPHPNIHLFLSDIRQIRRGSSCIEIKET